MILVDQMEGLIEDLKFNGFGKIRKHTEDGGKYKKDLENNISRLTNKLNIVTNELNSYQKFNTITYNDNTKLEYLGERVKREVDYMRKEIPLLKEKISEVKNIFVT